MRLRHVRPLPLLRLLLALAATLLLPTAVAHASDPGSVVLLPTTGVVDQVMSGYIGDAITAAENDGAAAVVIELDTPGGSLESMRTIVESELESRVPIIVWVAPSGARAGSAGTFISLAANILAMEPGSNIGAASPVDQSGQTITGTEGEKVLNDAVAFITSIATARHRPVDWAVSTVQEAKSYSVDDAIAAGAVDLKADSIESLLGAINGRTVQTAAGPVVLQTAAAPVDTVGLNPMQSLLHLLADPNIAFILFTVGFYGLLFEVMHPNFVTGILGAFAILGAFIGFGSLPLNVAGLLLLGLAIILFVLEFTVVSHGLLTIGGLIAFVLGAGALYSSPGTPTSPSVAVSGPLIVIMAGITVLVVLGIVRVAMRTRRMPKVNIGVAGTGSLLRPGTEGVVRRALSPVGTIYAAGEEWSARAATGAVVERGTTVHVVGQDGLVLLVTPEVQAAPMTTGFGPAHR